MTPERMESKRSRLKSDMDVAKQKNSFHLSYLKMANSNWEGDLNLSLKAELGEESEQKDNKQSEGKHMGYKMS
jgi:hypothetical protein